MQVDKQWMSKWYNYFNKEYFDNLLPKEGVLEEYTIQLLPINKNVKYLGCAYDDTINHRYRLKLNNKYNIYEVEWKNVLLHEMIHIWQYIAGYKGGHGITFRRKANEINKYGWGITTKYEQIY